jgi:signal transduction histidine kinase
LLWFGGMSFITLLLFSLSFHFFLNRSINDNLKISLQSIAKYIAVQIVPTINIETVISDKTLSTVGIAVVKDGVVIAKNSNYDLKNLKYYFNQKKSFFVIQDKSSDEYIDALYIDKNKDISIIIYKKNVANKIEEFQDILLFLVPILLLILVLLARKMINKILTPIDKLTKTANTISVSDFSKEIPLPHEDDEIKALVISFNKMIERLREGVDNLDRFNSDVSHELRTPLTVIKGEIEITLRRAREPQEYQSSMKTILEQTESIQNIVEQLLLLTKYSKESIKKSFELCSLDSILLTCIERFDLQLKEKRINLILENIEAISMQANASLMHSIFSNLIDNAIKYTSDEKNITLSLYKDSNIHFIIQDEGVGIQKDELLKITDRFYRADESRNKKIKGFGLGLSIVKKSVELHNGLLRIDSNLNQGTVVHILFMS